MRVAVQASQDRQGHTRPACRRAADGRAVRHVGQDLPPVQTVLTREKAAQAAAWASARALRHTSLDHLMVFKLEQQQVDPYIPTGVIHQQVDPYMPTGVIIK